nr:MAG TPA: hypothetical protein [Inoviridae sp.]
MPACTYTDEKFIAHRYKCMQACRYASTCTTIRYLS